MYVLKLCEETHQTERLRPELHDRIWQGRRLPYWVRIALVMHALYSTFFPPDTLLICPQSACPMKRKQGLRR